MNRLSTIAVALLMLAGAGPAPAQDGGAAAKKELVARLLQLQQGDIEMAATALAAQPAAQMLQQAQFVLQTQVPAERREAVAREIQADARRFGEEVVPLLRGRAIALAPSTIGPVLEQNFSEAERRELIAALESPVSRKFRQHASQMNRALVEKLANDARADVDPKLRALQQSIARRLQLASGGGPRPLQRSAPPASDAASGARQ